MIDNIHCNISFQIVGLMKQLQSTDITKGTRAEVPRWDEAIEGAIDAIGLEITSRQVQG